MTAYIHRLLLIVPAARIAALNTWIRANLDPTGSDWLTANLSASGNAPFTHGWFSAALTEQQAKQFLLRLVQQAGISQPAEWDGWTRAQKKTWVLSQRSAIRTALGVWVVPIDNDGVWDDPQTALDAMILKRRNASP